MRHLFFPKPVAQQVNYDHENRKHNKKQNIRQSGKVNRFGLVGNVLGNLKEKKE
jgi:hypothetical protein